MVFVFFYVVDALVFNVAKCGFHSKNASHIGCSCFVFIREGIEGGIFIANLVNHFTTKLVRRQAFQPGFFSEKNANSHWAISFVCRKSIKLTIQILHINFGMGNGLRTVNQNRNAITMGDLNHFFHGIDSSQNI